ncbi:hypothetical protein K2Y11_25065 [bacterium]|nr:hypothetical protein [bacterium]
MKLVLADRHDDILRWLQRGRGKSDSTSLIHEFLGRASEMPTVIGAVFAIPSFGWGNQLLTRNETAVCQKTDGVA